MQDRVWLLIGLALVILLAAVIVGPCSFGGLPAPEAPPQSEIEEDVRST